MKIWPNRHSAGLVAVLLAMAYAGASQGNGAAYLLCFVLAGVAAVSSIHAWANLRGVAVWADPIAPAFAGEPLYVTLALSSAVHKNHYAISVRTGSLNEWGKSDVVPAAGVARGREVEEACGLWTKCDVVPSTDVVRQRVEAPTMTRGNFGELGIVVQSLFPLGFLTARKIVTVRQPYFVYPAPRGDLPLPISDAATSHPKGGLRIAGDDFGGFRPWLPGESQRHIDWKAAARGLPLLTKQWSGESDEILRLDWDATEALEIEARLSQLAKWIMHAEEMGAQYELRLPGQSISPARGEAHFHQCLRALANFELVSSTEEAGMPIP